MAASSADHLTKVGSPGSATTLAAPGHLIGGTEISVVSTTNWSTDTGVIFAIDTVTIVNGEEVRDVGSYTEWEGVVSGATTITNMVLRYGTDQNYPAGSTTRVYIPVASSRENRLVDGLLEQHKQDGSHGAVTADSLVVADGGTIEVDTINEATSANGVVVDGLNIKDGKLNTNDSVVTANITDGALTNAKLNTAAGELGGEWLDWTPTLTNMTAGSGTITARYMRIGKTIHLVFKFVLGAGSAIGTNPQFSLPVTAHSASSGTFSLNAILNDAGTNSYVARVNLSSTTTATFFLVAATNAGSTLYPSTPVTATVPFTWTTNDSLVATVTYEAA